ncbi:MAG: hypothetical protein R2851_10020 [Caldilineaceae bacterium]
MGAPLPPLLQDVPWTCYNGAVVRRKAAPSSPTLWNRRMCWSWWSGAVASCLEWRVGLEIDDVLYLNQRLTISKEYVYQPDLHTVAHRPAAKVLYSNGALNADAVHGDAYAMFRALDPLLERLPGRTRPMLSYRYRLAQVHVQHCGQGRGAGPRGGRSGATHGTGGRARG